jgi:hypothetical protein
LKGGFFFLAYKSLRRCYCSNPFLTRINFAKNAPFTHAECDLLELVLGIVPANKASAACWGLCGSQPESGDSAIASPANYHQKY